MRNPVLRSKVRIARTEWALRAGQGHVHSHTPAKAPYSASSTKSVQNRCADIELCLALTLTHHIVPLVVHGALAES